MSVSRSVGRAFGVPKPSRMPANGRFSATVTMNEKLAKWLSEHSQSTGKSISEIVRGALIREGLAQRAKKGLPEDLLFFVDPPREDPLAPIDTPI
jgi:hypothetical protein